MNWFVSLLCTLFLIGCGGCSNPPPPPPPPPPVSIDVTAFLRTVICADGSLAALTPGCPSQIAQGATPINYWRYDWAHTDQMQIQNTYVLDNGSGWVATFNYPPHGTFNASNGDGGDVFVNDGGTVRISYTQNGQPDGGSVAGWWVGSRCGGTGWLSYDQYINDQGWREWTAKLKGALDPNACPKLDSAYTRARLVRSLPIYFILQDPAGNITTQTVPLDAVVTEHYAGSTFSGATSMERMIHVKDVGPSVYWEAWVKNPPEAPPVYQCVGVPGGWSDAPGPEWVLWDRRCRTVIRQANPVLTGDQWGWPPTNATQ